MILHSYRIGNKKVLLDKHLLHTFIAVYDTHLGRRLEKFIRRIAVVGGYNEDALIGYAYLPIILHDIGKALLLYQLESTGWKKRYFLHELVGAILLYDLFKNSIMNRLYELYVRKEIPKSNVVLSMIIIPVLRHHYASRDVPDQITVFVNNTKHINKEYLRFQRNSLIVLFENIRREASKKNKVLGDILKEVQESLQYIPEHKLCIYSNNSVLYRRLQYIINEVNHAYNEEQCRPHPSSYLPQMLSLITGILSIADYLVASIERPPLENPEKPICCKGYVRKIYRRNEIINVYNMIKRDLGIKCINLEEYNA